MIVGAEESEGTPRVDAVTRDWCVSIGCQIDQGIEENVCECPSSVEDDEE